MIEVIYKEEKQEANGNEGMFAVPRNIRQIGLSNEDYRIYVEDYVYTFLVRLSGADTEGENEKGHLAVLTGETKWQSGVTYVFVRGALTVDKTEAAADHIDFTEKAWTKIHDEQELYFPGQEIVGWFFAQQELPLEITEVFKRVHLKHFGGGEKVLMLMDPAEREDAFFRYENSFLVRQPGYYLFYEKNPLMQNYMLDKNHEVRPEQTEEVPDEAVVAFRKIIGSKKKSKKEESKEQTRPDESVEQDERPSVFSYAATACLAIAVLAVGVNFYRNYESGYSAKQQITTASSTAAEGKRAEVTEIPEKGVTPVPSLGGTKGSVSFSDTEESQEKKNTVTEGDVNDKGKETAQTEKSETAGQGSDKKSAESAPEQKQETGGNTKTESASVENKKKSDNANQESSTDGQDVEAVEQETGAEGQAQEETQIYQEESDLRKAKRKQEAAEEEMTEQNKQGTEQAASSDSVHTPYVIRPGDTLYQISIEKYGSMDAISEICRLNGLSEEEIIYPGQIIVLP